MNEITRWKQFDLTALAGPAGELAIDDPRRELRIGTAIAVLFFVLFLGWAAFAPMDAAAYAPANFRSRASASRSSTATAESFPPSTSTRARRSAPEKC